MLACHQVLQSDRRHQLVLSANERFIWRLLVAGMVALGVNKQLDLQSALTELARLYAHEQGWYGNRRQFQQAFIAAVPILGLTVLAALSVLILLPGYAGGQVAADAASETKLEA